MKTIVFLLLLASSAFAEEPKISCQLSSKASAVSSAQQAIAAAKSAWNSVYEKASWQQAFSPGSVAASEPYSAVLSEGVWFVSGKSVVDKLAPVAYVCLSDGSVSVTIK